MGAVGIGLFRTEYLFLTHPDVPDEEEQLAAYRDDHRRQPEPTGHDPHARSRRRQDDSLSRATTARPIRSWAGARSACRSSIRNSSCTQIRAILRAAVQGARREQPSADDVSHDHDAGRDAPRAHDGPQGANGNSRPKASRLATVADRLDARSAGRRGLDPEPAGRSGLRFDRLERSGAISDGRRPRQSEGQPSLPAAQPGRCSGCWPARYSRPATTAGQTGHVVRRNGRRSRGRSCCCSAWACAVSA